MKDKLRLCGRIIQNLFVFLPAFWKRDRGDKDSSYWGMIKDCSFWGMLYAMLGLAFRDIFLMIIHPRTFPEKKKAT